MTPDYVKTMSQYNQWMNDKLYTICAGIPDGDRKKDRQAFFKSIQGTLNHILLADKVWMGRFENKPFKVSGLDQILYEDFDELYNERKNTDARIEKWVSTLTTEQLNADFEFTSITSPGLRTCKLGKAVMHFFNHQTHHRGQLTTLLNQMGIDPGITDLLYLPGVVTEIEN